ncbi:hypothetical protein Tcan_18694 [Toxocara canis]|uniref:Major sperm protein n=1 Tax=Toxocara canis TaxID=6265 RepID=A0A0B2USL6_TOXCA|nr:hypothetical protein Tcan_18694 [Toxocara canis]
MPVMYLSSYSILERVEGNNLFDKAKRELVESMWTFIVLIMSHLSFPVVLIASCRPKKQTAKPTIVAPLPAPKPEEKPEGDKKEGEKPEGDKKEGESDQKKSESETAKKEVEKKDQNAEEKKEGEKKEQESSKKERAEEKKEPEEEKTPYMPKDLHWRSEEGTVKYGVQKILLMNTVGKRQAFKMKCTDNNIYTVKPTYTFLEKDEVVDIEVTRVEGGEAKEDKIFLFHMTCPLPADQVDDDKATDAEPLFSKEDDAYEHYIVPLIADP